MSSVLFSLLVQLEMWLSQSSKFTLLLFFLIEEMFVRAVLAKFGFGRCQEIWTKKINKKLWSTSGAWKPEKKTRAWLFVSLPFSLSLSLSLCHLPQSIVGLDKCLSRSLVLILKRDNALSQLYCAYWVVWHWFLDYMKNVVIAEKATQKMRWRRQF